MDFLVKASRIFPFKQDFLVAAKYHSIFVNLKPDPNLKITIVCGHFIPSLGYLEVHLARAFAQLGHETSVITSTAIPAYVGNLNSGFGEDPEGVEVIRLKPKFSLGQIVIARGIKKELNRLNPDLAIVIGLGKAFPKPVFDTNFPIVSLFGDNAHSYSNGSLKTKLLFSFFKKSTYQKAIDNSKRLIAYTPESFEAAAKILDAKRAAILRKQTDFISLGFWPEDFYFSSDLRKAKRDELHFSESDKVIITATRLVPDKKLEEAIPLFEKSPNHLKWLLVGSAGDTYSKELEAELGKRLGNDRFKILGYADKSNLNALYNAADLALYTVPAISIFEAVGTGLSVVLPDEKSLSHIAEAGFRIAEYREGKTDLSEWLKSEESDSEQVARTKEAQSKFGWKEIAERLLAIANMK